MVSFKSDNLCRSTRRKSCQLTLFPVAGRHLAVVPSAN